MRHEMALHLDDVVFRRTGLGTLGHPGVPAIKQAAELMRAELGWDETELANEISGTVRRVRDDTGEIGIEGEPMSEGMPHVAAIVNPRSGGGRTGRAWRVISETLEKELGPVRAHFTAAPRPRIFCPPPS